MLFRYADVQWSQSIDDVLPKSIAFDRESSYISPHAKPLTCMRQQQLQTTVRVEDG
jgi:hypothetical protein